MSVFSLGGDAANVGKHARDRTVSTAQGGKMMFKMRAFEILKSVRE